MTRTIEVSWPTNTCFVGKFSRLYFGGQRSFAFAPNFSDQVSRSVKPIKCLFQNWRNCHVVPLNQFHDALQDYVLNSSPLTYIVQRPKRIEAVIKKLQRDKPSAQLSTMQDIAGCRAIVKSIDDINPLVEACKQMWPEHKLLEPDDYIEKPNPKTGYRSVHLVFKFKSNNPSFNGRFVEVQIRTREPHAWATAVETVDLIQRIH